MSRPACTVEAVELQCEDKHFVTLPERIWQRDDMMLVAAGSLSCMRTLYFRAMELGKRHQFIPCPVTRCEYGSGQYEEKLLRCLEAAAARPGVGGVILYASCIDVLVGLDFDRLVQRMAPPVHVPVRILYRGPLVKRTRDMAADLDEILAAMPPATGRILRTAASLPPLPPDFSGAASLLQVWDTYNFLVSPGGCAGCISLPDGVEETYRLEHSRLTDLQISLGCEELVAGGIAHRFPTSGRAFCAVMGSAVPAVVGFDQRRLGRLLEKTGVPAVFLPCNGFAPAQVGVSRALEVLGRTLLKPSGRREQRVNLLGYYALGLGGLAAFSAPMDYLRELGYHCEVWGSGPLSHVQEGTAAALNWVVSVEGLALAEHMKTEYGVPYVCGLPMGRTAFQRWQEEVCAVLGRDSAPTAPPEFPPTPSRKKALVLSQPMAAVGVRALLSEELDLPRTQAASYAPGRELRELFLPYARREEVSLLTGPDDLGRTLSGTDLVLADPVFAEQVRLLAPNAVFLPLPDPVLSGRFAGASASRYLGPMGGAVLRADLSAIGFSDVQQ